MFFFEEGVYYWNFLNKFYLAFTLLDFMIILFAEGWEFS